MSTYDEEVAKWKQRQIAKHPEYANEVRGQPDHNSQSKGWGYWLLVIALIAGICSILGGLFSWTTPANHMQDIEVAMGKNVLSAKSDAKFDYEKAPTNGERFQRVTFGLLWCGGALYGLHWLRVKKFSESARVEADTR